MSFNTFNQFTFSQKISELKIIFFKHFSLSSIFVRKNEKEIKPENN